MARTTPETHPLAHRLEDAFAASFQGDGAPGAFAALRRRAMEAFVAEGFPTPRREAWKYTDLRRTLRSDYALQPAAPALSVADLDALDLPGLDASRLVVADGHFVEALADLSGLPEGVMVSSLRGALASGHPVALAHFAHVAAVEGEPFAALNTAFDLDGFFVHVPDGTVVERPIHIVHLTTTDEPAFVQSRHLVVVGDRAQVTLVETHATRGTAGFGNHLTEWVVGEEAVVDHVRVQGEGDDASGVNAVAVQQGGASTFRTLTFTFGGHLLRNEVQARHEGERCATAIGGLYVLRGGQHLDTHTLLDHAAPNGTSDELFKGIVFDHATGVFNGKVLVRRAAQGTNAYQQSQGVVLSDDARHFSKPELEIYADDVKCSHGSTTGAIDAEALFYCRARGISEAVATALLLYAFAHDVVERVPLPALRDWLDRRIEARLK